MRSLLSLGLIAASCLSAQKAPTPVVPAEEITRDQVIGTMNGRNLTVGEFESIISNLSGPARQLAGTNPKEFLQQYAYSLVLMNEAAKMGLDQKSPWKEKLAEYRRQMLIQALVTQKNEDAKVGEAEARKFYEANPNLFREAEVRVIFISRGGYTMSLTQQSPQETTPDGLRRKVDAVIRLLKEGGDFVAAAKKYSDDSAANDRDARLGQPIRGYITTTPQDIREAILNAKAGETVGPLEHASGWYFFRIDSRRTIPFAEARTEAERRLKEQGVNSWLEAQKSKASVSLGDDGFWQAFIAGSKTALEQEAAGGAK